MLLAFFYLNSQMKSAGKLPNIIGCDFLKPYICLVESFIFHIYCTDHYASPGDAYGGLCAQL